MKFRKLFVLVMSFLLVFMALPFSQSASADVHSHDSINFTDVFSASSVTYNGSKYVLPGGNYILTEDTVIESDMYVLGGTTVNICLNGYKLTCYNFIVGDFFGNGDPAALNIYDCSADKKGEVVFSTVPAHTLNDFAVYHGSLSLNGGKYSSVDQYGSVIYSAEGTTINIKNANLKTIWSPMMISYGTTLNVESSTIEATGQDNAPITYSSGSTKLVATLKDTVLIGGGRSDSLGIESGEWTFDGCDIRVILELSNWSGTLPSVVTLKDTKAETIYVDSGAELKLSGNNEIESILMMHYTEDQWKVNDYLEGSIYFREPKTIKVVGKLTNEDPIPIFELMYLYSIDYPTTPDPSISGFDTYNAGDNYLDYFCAYDAKEIDSYMDMVYYLSKKNGVIYFNKLALTHDATNSEQYVTTNAKDRTPKYQWYKVTPSTFTYDDSFLTTPSYELDEAGTYSKAVGAWLPEANGVNYYIGRALDITDDVDEVKQYIPKNSVMLSGVYQLTSSLKLAKKSAKMVVAEDTFTCTIRVKHNGGEWETVTDQNYSAMLSKGTYSDGVWSPVYEDYRYYLDVHVEEDAGSYQYEVTALDDIVIWYSWDCEPGEYWIHYESSLNNPIVVSATGNKLEAVSGGTTYKNTATQKGDYLCKISVDDAVVESSIVTLSKTVKKTNPTYEVPTEITVYLGQALKDIELPEGFSFQDDLGTVLNELGEKEFLLTYTPSDRSKYNVVKDIPVKFVIEKPVGYASSELPDQVKLIVKVVAKSVSEIGNSTFDFNTLDEDKKIKEDEEVGLVYNVKLIQIVNGVEKEVQPSDLEGVTSIKVKMLIPEDVDVNKITRILHIHNDNDVTEYQFDKNKMDDDRYYEIEIDKLSEFAYVVEKADSDNPKEGACKVHIVFIALSILMLLALVCALLKKKKNVALISGAIGGVLTVITSFFKECDLCNTWMIVSLIIAAILIIVGLIIKKDK